MCGRYYIDDTFQKELLTDFPSFREQAGALRISSGDVRPTDAAPVIMAERSVMMSGTDRSVSRTGADPSCPRAEEEAADGNRKETGIWLTEAHWGFQENYDSRKKLLINARTETADTKAAFRYAMQAGRCVIPVSGFYEYTPDKVKVSFFRKEERVIYLAGCAKWTGEWRFVILTMSPNDDVKKVHDRMPVMLRQEDVRTWVCGRQIPKTLAEGWKPSLESYRPYEQMSLFDQ